MYLTIIILPFLGSIAVGLFGRKLGIVGSQIITLSCILITSALAIISFFEIGFTDSTVTVHLFQYLGGDLLNIGWTFKFDSLTVSMLLPVTFISLLVQIYSVSYLKGDPHCQRFFCYLTLFTAFMGILVSANNYLVLFVGWEGIGVCSYLLVNFWYTSITANQNAISAFVTNRIGDACLTMGLMILILVFGGLEYSTVFTQVPYINENVIFIIGLCLILGALAKSAQIGLHIWLPLAMCAPTSVSALLHSATMVTAGVYLLLRSSPLIEFSDTILLICFWLGAVTTIFSSLVGLFQQDIKKIIAYSTISQLGLMMLAVGLSSYNIAIFHLVNHAFYKALLFMGAGSIIHAMQDNQDLRKYGGLLAYLPLTYIIMLIGSLSLMAIPFMTGFYSKDLILESAYGLYQLNGVTVYILATTGAAFTTLYSVRILYLTFISSPLGSWSAYKNTHEGDLFLTFPLVVLALFSIIFGFLTKDIFVGLGTGFFGDNSLFVNPSHEILLDTEFSISASLKFLPFLLTVGLSLAGLVYQELWAQLLLNLKLEKLGIITFGFFNQRLLIEMLYNKFIVNSILDFGGHTTKILDKGSIEWVGPYGLYVILTKISRTVSAIWAGDVQSYALYILLGVCFFLTTLSLVVLSRTLDVMFILLIASVVVLLY